MKKLLIIVIICLCPLLSLGQVKDSIIIQLFTPDVISEATLDQKPFLEWFGKVQQAVQVDIAKIKGNKELYIVLTAHKDKDVTISIGGRPKISKETVQKLSKTIRTIPSPRTKIVDFSLAIIVNINGGVKDKNMPFDPMPVIPEEQKYLAFKKADLAGKRADMQAWAKDEILPIIAHYTSNVEAKFEGVINIGKMLKDKDVLNKPIEELTDKNPDYWRATMEMNLGNQLIPFTKVALLMAKGEFDRARNLLNIIGFFYDKKSLPSVYHRALQGKLQAMYNELGKLVNKGIKLHDAKKYKEAVKHYNQVAKQFPNSAWLNYEIYFSTTFPMKDKETKADQDKAWQKWKKIIYANDPMYHMDVRANSGREGYLLYQRQRTDKLFREKDKFKSDFVAYADIALDLENYGLAAQAYWLILSYLPKETYKNRNILAHYLYCLDKLGNKKTIKIFKGNFKKEFKKIKEERISLMKKSTIYNSFQNKD